ncbi:MAG: hypothetical protein ACTHKA_08525 [Anaerocolumna jejuensis]
MKVKFALFTVIYYNDSVKEKRIYTPLFIAVPQTYLRYATGASMKEKRFHTPLFMAVLQTCLQYAMGASVISL